MMNGKSNVLAVFVVLLGAVSYGIVSPVFKLAVASGWNGQHLTFQQVVSGTVLLWLTFGIARLSGVSGRLRLSWTSLFRLVIIGIVGVSLVTLFLNQALTLLNASLAIVLLFQFTWITILLESVRRRRWPSRYEWAAVILTAVGTLLAVGLFEQDFGRPDRWGVIFALLAAVTYALFFFLTDILPVDTDPIAKSAVMATASFVLVSLIHIPTAFDWSGSGPIFGWGLLLGFLGTAFPFICFNYGIPKVGGGLAALLGALELPAAIIASFFILGEPLSWLQGAGIVLILAGIMAAQQKSKQSAESRQGG
jgi:drug/metabolite transporter (DMT)-like permease